MTAAVLAAPPPRAGGSATSTPYGRHISWAGCSGVTGPAAMECGTVTVPRDYAHPKSADLHVAVSRIPATGPGRRLGSLVVNFGGPGIPGIAELAERTAEGELARLNRRYDLIGFDPRGTGRSSPVDCGDLSGVTATDPAGQARQVAQACREHSGSLLRWVGTPNAARDLDVVRSALGDDRLTYLGFSYGGRLGSVYAHEFPERMGRMVLDGVPDPTLDDTETALAQAAGFQHALDDFAADCVARGCPVPGRTAAEVVAGIAAAGRRLGRSGLPTVTGQLDRISYLQGVQNALYSKDDWLYLREALNALRSGDGELMMQLAFPGRTGTLSTRSAPGTYEMAKLAIDCRDTPERHTVAGVHALDGRFAAASPVFGALVQTTLLSCTGWPPGDPASRRVSAPTAPKALLVGTTGDPATPYPGAAHMATALGNGSLVLTYRGEGHGAYFAHNPCVTSTVEAYLIDGRTPGAAC